MLYTQYSVYKTAAHFIRQFDGAKALDPGDTNLFCGRREIILPIPELSVLAEPGNCTLRKTDIEPVER